MRKAEFEAYLRKRGFSDKVIKYSVGAVRELEGTLTWKLLNTVAVADLGVYIESLITRKRNSERRLVAIARYFHVVGNNPAYIYLVSLIGPRGILPALEKRVASIAGEEARARVFQGIREPQLGSPPEAWSGMTKRVVERLERQLPAPVCRKALAGNLHRVPLSAFREQKELFAKSRGIDDFLKKIHERSVAEIESFMKAGRLWYEQEITPEVLALVRGNQELLSGVRQGDRIYMTKIPYAPKDWLVEKDPLRRRYLACHCPLARESIISGRERVSGTWCYCSAGFEKLLFDVVFGEEVEAEVLESVLAGDGRCRFAITIPEKYLKGR
ncbi:MAG: DUF6144 family protein [Candidatus Methanomethylicaceae archaeon]|jgi:hypothetical protein